MSIKQFSKKLHPIKKRHVTIVVAAVTVLAATASLALVNDQKPHEAKAATTGWMSGASGDSTPSGAFQSWRGETVTIAGDWNDVSPAAQVGVWNLVPGGKYANWNKPIDIAIGAIFEGETWANAANGAYDARWRQAAQAAKANWTDKGKNESYLYFRFGHEMNGGYPWKVMSGQEANYKTAWARWYGVMKSVLPKAHSSWCPSKENFGGATARPVDYFPDPNTVDVVCVDWYNTYPWCGTTACLDTQFNRMNGSQPVGLESWRKFAESKGKPFAIGEWGNASPGSNGTNSDGSKNGGDNDVFMKYINAWMNTHAGTTSGKLLYEIYFNLWPEYTIYGSQARQPITASTYQSLSWGSGGIYEPGGGGTTPTPVISQTDNLANGKTFVSSVADSTSEAGNPVANVNDKDESTRWISQPADGATVTTDLGATYALNKVSILWAADTIKNYDIQVSANNTSWTTVASGTTNNSQKQLVDITSFSGSATGRYFRIVAKDRWNTTWGNSIWEIGLYGNVSTASAPGDVNNDGRVNALDLSLLISNDGKNYPAADFNNDGIVGAADLAILLSKWTW